jgi:Protein of unknown function (DUF3565)
MATLSERMRALDARLEPIAKRPVKFEDIPHLEPARPLDEAGVRPDAESLLMELVRAYEQGDADARAEIRADFNRYTSFAWAASLPAGVRRDSADGFRTRLLHFSMRDQERDPRDATLWLDDLVRTALAAGVDVAPILREVAELSATEDVYGWGSTRDWLLRRVPQPTIERRITGFHQDERGDWVAELECGHSRHVRHNPPWENRPWVVDAAMRDERVGTLLSCEWCAAARVP